MQGMSGRTPADALDQHFLEAVRALRFVAPAGRVPVDPAGPLHPAGGLTGELALALFDAQIGNRHLDLAARYLRAAGKGFYTIGSSGHEANAPVAGGRHKVFGHPDLAVIPQTSTIASQLPRAVGVAFVIDRAKKLGVASRWPADAIAVTSFGDASASHSTAVGAINTACQVAYQGLPMPLLFVCEDNGLGISVRTPAGWIAAAYSGRPPMRYFTADGADLAACYDAARAAAAYVRARRAPAFLHLRLVRFMAHAGSDAEVSYRSPGEIAADYERDPLVGTARLLVGSGLLTPGEVMERYEMTRGRGRGLADALAAYPQLLVFGEDVGRTGGVYGVTRGLARRFGVGRVFDTLLDEQSILGLGLGAGVSGLLPVPEIQYLAYLHNAEDQLRGEAASLQFFSNGQYRNPMVV